MKKRDPLEMNALFYDEEGTSEVTEQIMNAYSSGVIGEHQQEEYNVEGQTE